MAAQVTEEATLSSIAGRLQAHHGELALHLIAQEALTLETNLVVHRGTVLFLDGRGSLIKLGNFRINVEDGGRLCLFNTALIGGMRGALSVGNQSSPVVNASLNVGWVVFSGMQVHTSILKQLCSSCSYVSFDAQSSAVELWGAVACHFSECQFTDNKATATDRVTPTGQLLLGVRQGGAVVSFGAAVLTISSCWFIANTARDEGGALYVENAAMLIISSSSFFRNYIHFLGRTADQVKRSEGGLGGTFHLGQK